MYKKVVNCTLMQRQYILVSAKCPNSCACILCCISHRVSGGRGVSAQFREGSPHIRSSDMAQQPNWQHCGMQVDCAQSRVVVVHPEAGEAGEVPR